MPTPSDSFPDASAGAGDRAPPSAPEHIRYCAACGARMRTREIAGKPRRACPECGYIHFVEAKVGVGAMIIERGRLLLVRRAKDPERGKWCIPAGYLDYAEDPRRTAMREVAEETGLEVEIGAVVDVFSNPVGAGASIFVLYRARRVGGELKAGDDAEAAEFFAPHALPSDERLAFSSTHAAIQALRG